MLNALLLGVAIFALPTMNKIRPFGAGDVGALCGPGMPCQEGLVCHGTWGVFNGKRGFGSCAMPCASGKDCAVDQPTCGKKHGRHGKSGLCMSFAHK